MFDFSEVKVDLDRLEAMIKGKPWVYHGVSSCMIQTLINELREYRRKEEIAAGEPGFPPDMPLEDL